MYELHVDRPVGWSEKNCYLIRCILNIWILSRSVSHWYFYFDSVSTWGDHLSSPFDNGAIDIIIILQAKMNVNEPQRTIQSNSYCELLAVLMRYYHWIDDNFHFTGSTFTTYFIAVNHTVTAAIPLSRRIMWQRFYFADFYSLDSNIKCIVLTLE